jgi:branched-chain amino acid transport system ATP-binding protein
MLETRTLSVFYGRHRAVEDASVRVAREEIVVMLGANGAGKSTFLRAVAGLVRSAEGSAVLIDGNEITRSPPHEIVEAGIALVPEDRGVFADLSVRENLTLGAYPQRARAEEAANLERVLALFPRLAEPSLGLSPILCSELFRSLARVKETGVGILLVEQNARQGLAIADRGYLLDNGRITGADTAEALAQDEAVQKAYLGAH